MAYTAIDDPTLYFEAVTYTGNTSGGTTNNDLSFQPNMVWFKSRTQAENHQIYDSVRGATKRLVVNGTQAEATAATGLTSFDSDGFTTGGEQETDSGDIVAWCWKESVTAGFDIVTYTGNGTDDTDISHNLSAVPKMIIVKNRDATDAWQIYHAGNTSAPETDYLVLNTTAATADNADRWSDEAPTSSVFTLGDADEVNTNTENYIAYCFADVQGFSKVSGSYVGNGSTDGAFLYLGFRPAMVLIKATSTTSEWNIYDNKRLGYNPDNNLLYPKGNNAEATTDTVDLLSNGFKCISTGDPNSSGRTYIYMAFAEAPLVNSNGVPCNAR